MYDMKKAKVDGKIINIVSPQEIIRHGTNEDSSYTGVINDDDGIIYPVRNASDRRPGFYRVGCLYGKYKQPTKSEIDNYRATEDSVVDFSNKTHIQDIINAQNKLRNMESTVLTSTDNITIPVDKDTDRPEMLGLKEAIRCKHIDLDKHEQRFGLNYNNDRRLLDKNSITLAKLITYGNALDMEISLTFKDKSSNVPNPIGKEITVVVTDDPED